jgi:aminoglycoside/choline kinase family phosphotransferase
MSANLTNAISETGTRIRAFLPSVGIADGQATVVPLTGDASDRRYFRVLRRDGRSLVLAVYPGAFVFEELSFGNVARLLAAMPVPVPTVLGHSNPLGIVALEDLGDVTLQAHLGTAPASEHTALYREAVTLITTMQRRGAEMASSAFVPYSVAFDVEKLTWELQYFTRHFLEGYHGRALSPATREALAGEWDAITAELAAEPRVLCHRDYHSRNLMLHGGRLHVIDFQDARMGPDTYDLASLLRDSYVDLTESQVEDLIAFFLALGHHPSQGATPEPREFRRRFDLMAVQRNLKALGTFGFQATTRANPVYIQYMPRTLAYVRSNLRRYSRFSRLEGILAGLLPEHA